MPKEPDVHSRMAGAVLGAAIGDAMGHPTEFLSAAAIRRQYPPSGVTGFERWWESNGRRFAPYTDDTQMSEIVLRALIKGPRAENDLESVMQEIAEGFVDWSVNPQGGHRAPGNACLAGAAQLATGVHWSRAGGERAGGCGSVMRAYPFGLLFVVDPERAASWAVEHSKMTHRDPIALAACAAMAVGIALTMQGQRVEAVLDAMVQAARRLSATTAEMMVKAMADARNGADPASVLGKLQGWAAHEAISAAVFVVARHAEDVRSAILEGANADGDSDSIATLAGAIVGARVGIEAIPSDWTRDVERSQELLLLAQEAAEQVSDLQA